MNWIVFKRIIPIILLSIIAFSSTASSGNAVLYNSIGMERNVYFQTKQEVDVTTTSVEASVFTPNVTTAVVEVSETSLEVTEFQERGLGDTASILIILVLTALIIYIIYRRRGLLKKP